jgi:hypothetical protein
MAPARRAAVLMWLFGAMAVLAGVLVAIGGNSVTPEELAKVRPESAEQARMMEKQLGVSLGTIYLIMGLIAIAIGGVVGGVAFLVRRGGFGAVVTAIILTGMLLLMMLVFSLSLLVAGGAEGVVALCMLSVPSAVLVYQFVTLIQAARGASQAALAAQWAQVQQAQWAQAQAQQPHVQGYMGQVPPPSQETRPATPAPSAPPVQPSGGHGGWGYAAPAQFAPVQSDSMREMPPEPPPGQPPVQFGYATRPLTPQQPAAPPQEQPPPSQQTPPDATAS